MFGILKNKLSKAIESISKKLKEPDKEKVEPSAHPAEPVVEQHKTEDAVEQETSNAAEPELQVQEEPVAEIETQVEPEIEQELKPEPQIDERVKVAEPVAKEAPAVKVVEPETKAKVKNPEKPKSFFKRAFEKVTKKIVEKRLEEKDLLPILDELEVDLVESDVAVGVAQKIKADLIKELAGKDIKRGKESEVVIEAFKNSIRGILSVPEIDLKDMVAKKKPIVVLFIGFNGAGKTTSIAKLANWLKKEGMTSVLAAADTFRAASIEQLEEHAGKIGVKLVKHDYGADPAAVIYDAIEHAKAKGLNFVLADSAGRVHTNENLMKELQKIVRVGKPDLKILVVDSLTGNDALMQAEAFGEIGVDGVIFTKVDVNEKGGAILSVTHMLKKPILFLGIGQEYGEFVKFSPDKFVSNLFGSS